LRFANSSVRQLAVSSANYDIARGLPPGLPRLPAAMLVAMPVANGLSAGRPLAERKVDRGLIAS